MAAGQIPGQSTASAARHGGTRTGDLDRARFFTEIVAVWLGSGVPLPLDPKAPPALVEVMTRRVATGTHICNPWKAILCVTEGTYRPLFTGGEPPTVPRKARAVGLGNAGPALFASPLHFNGPFEFAVRQLLLGGAVIVLDRFDPSTWAQMAAVLHPRWVFLAPIQIVRLLDAVSGDALRRVLVGLQTLLHTAAPCPPELRARLVDLIGADRVAEFYGTAEYDGTFARADITQPGGMPIPGAELRVVDGARQVVPTGTVGAIEGRSTVGLVSHYAGEPCQPADAWRTVGDQGRLSASGRLTVTSVEVPGRAIVGGVKVALARVHAVVCSHPAVLSCQVIPVADAEYGQVISLRVATGGRLGVQVLADYCAARLRPAERPRHIHLADPGSDHVGEGAPDALAV